MIRVRDLSKSYSEVRAVDGVSFDVAAGEVVGLLGPNGAGKSTTMKILTGFLYPDGGEVWVDGRPVDPEDPDSKAPIGYLPETTPLYPRMRVGEYLDFIGRMRGLGRAERRDAAERVLGDCGLEGWERRRIGTLSKGYRQRVGLAQALFGDPKVLVLDEPTSGLDPAEITRIRALIERLGRTKTVVLSTHVLAEVQETCARVIILAGGRVVADGATSELAEEGRVELRITLTGLDDRDVCSVFAALETVRSARRLRTAHPESSGRVTVALEVHERWSAADEVQALAVARGWRILELGHDLPSLERVFLDRTEARSIASHREEVR
ncbi:MAG TPA: ATP-binding cassette domain-containing protein [Planctomycetes bacterium]|nr:ATP-binding cassette domain-containing protein [Planctomycetota bacterium]